MAWFTSKVNLSTIVSQGLEHVHKLKDDVEKQFDDAVSGGKPPARAQPSAAPAPSSTWTAAPQWSPQRSAAQSPPQWSPQRTASPSPPRSNPTPYHHQESNGAIRSGVATPPNSTDGNKTKGKPREINFFSEWNLGPSKRDVKRPGDAKPLNFVSTPMAMQTNKATSPATPLLNGNSSPINQTVSNETIKSRENSPKRTPSPPVSHTTPIEIPNVSLPPKEEKLDSPSCEDVRTTLSIISAATTVSTESDERPSTTSSISQTTSDDPAVDEALQAALTKTQALLNERENQLMSTSSKMTKLMEELEAAKTSAVTDVVVLQLQHALHEKEEQLAQLLAEGQALSVKQGQFESRLRVLRKENNDLIEERDKTAQALETVQAKWETARNHLVQAEEERKQTQAKLKVFEASQDELCSALESLEKANNRILVLEEQQLQWNADKLALEASQNVAADHQMLESTLLEMQKRVASIESDAARREELARDEISSWKKRYQEAVYRMDNLAEETSGATQPLLRQLTQLQQENQQRELYWRTYQQNADVQLQSSVFQCRTLEAQLAHEQSTRRGLEEHIDMWKHQIKSIQAQLEAATHRIRTLEEDEIQWKADLERMKNYIQELEKKDAMTKSTNDSSALVLSLQNEVKRAKEQEATWLAQIRKLESQLKEASQRSAFRERKSSSELSLPSNTGDVSLIEWNQLQQKLRLRESETTLLKSQLNELEELKKSNGDELTRLTQRNVMLESKELELETTKVTLEAVTVRQNVLLELLGEKEEQLEELETEFRECKALYQSQIDALTRDRK
ncbi:TATA element modulatory factor-like [Thraustotheca clavata]|uniref:TATA element modulatory factor-like n=1 Tax=Thraustotheca clavata TaxID=74557 RepID=A0A1W0A451_9STRA|nr:TATA element modulatory factor-like [Thraustotheca clavata]